MRCDENEVQFYNKTLAYGFKRAPFNFYINININILMRNVQ